MTIPTELQIADNDNTPIPPTPSSRLHTIFFGANGLRAGWSILVFFTLLAAFIYAATAISHRLHPPSHRTAQQAQAESESVKSTFVSEGVPLLGLLLVTWIMSKIERRPTSVYGLGGSRRLTRFFAGMAWGVSCLSLLILVLCKTGHLVIDTRLLFGGEILRYGAVWLTGFLLVALLEECLVRG